MYIQYRCAWCGLPTDKELKTDYLSTYAWLICDKCTIAFRQAHQQHIQDGYVTEDDGYIYTPDGTWIKCRRASFGRVLLKSLRLLFKREK